MLNKSDEMNSNVFKLTKEKLLSIANNATKKDSRPSNNRGYHKLKSTWIPRSCQTMKDHPQQLNFSYWNREDVSLLEHWIADKPDTAKEQLTVDSQTNSEVNFENWITSEEADESFDNSYDLYSNFNNQIEEVDIEQVRSIENWLQGRPDNDASYSISSSESLDNDETSSRILPDENRGNITKDNNNNGFKTDPVIVMNDDFIEIHFDSETTLKQPQGSLQKVDNKRYYCNKSDNVETDHYRIIKTKGLSPRHPPLYKHFLEKNITDNSTDDAQSFTDSSDSIENDNNLVDEWEAEIRQSCYNEHRQLFQYLPKVEDVPPVEIETTNLHKTQHFKRICSYKIKSDDLSSSYADSKRDLKSFLSFRKPKKSQCKHRFVVGEDGVSGPIWPAVLLTFDRGISPTPDSKPNQLSTSSS